MASADALDDEWWLDPSEREGNGYSGKRKGSPNTEKPKNKKKRKTISQELSTKESCLLDYSAENQRQEMWSFLNRKLSESTTVVEMSQIQLPVKSFVSYHDDEIPTSSLPEFSQFFTKVCSRIDKWVKRIADERGSPCVIIITSSASRALQLRHQLIESCGMKTVAKLFSKHMKIEEQRKQLKESVIPIAVATPDRLTKLLSDGSVCVNKLRRIIFDWNWRNQKLKRLVDIPEVSQSVCVLYKDHLNDLIEGGKLKLVLY